MTKVKILMMLLGLVATSGSLFSQKEYDLYKLNAYEDAEGRFVYIETGKKDKPLSGLCKVTDNYNKQYLIAEFKNGMYNGLCKAFRNTLPVSEITYKNGIKDGPYKTYNKRGDLESGRILIINEVACAGRFIHRDKWNAKTILWTESYMVCVKLICIRDS